jgi:hypothetical protein
MTTMLRFNLSGRGKLTASNSGQAAVEFALGVTLLLILVCASIDFGRAMYQTQVLSELSRQGSSLALRGEGTTTCDTMCTAIADLLAGDSGLNLSGNGKIIMTELSQKSSTNGVAGPSGGPYTIVEQEESSGGLSVSSKLGSSGTVTITGAPGIQNGQYLYVTEIFYGFSPATPIGTLTNNAVGMPSTLYDIAYF